jgi:hypothetical protein
MPSPGAKQQKSAGARGSRRDGVSGRRPSANLIEAKVGEITWKYKFRELSAHVVGHRAFRVWCRPIQITGRSEMSISAHPVILKFAPQCRLTKLELTTTGFPVRLLP